jgi:hypothetical protein
MMAHRWLSPIRLARADVEQQLIHPLTKPSIATREAICQARQM